MEDDPKHRRLTTIRKAGPHEFHVGDMISLADGSAVPDGWEVVSECSGQFIGTTPQWRPIETVADLIAVLERCDPDLPIATHANGHTCEVGHAWSSLQTIDLRVALLSNGRTRHVVIGNLRSRDVNGPNGFIEEELDGGPALPSGERER